MVEWVSGDRTIIIFIYDNIKNKIIIIIYRNYLIFILNIIKIRFSHYSRFYYIKL